MRGTIKYTDTRSTDRPFTCPPVYDVVIVGAGVVGCALAYELSQYRLRVLLLDRNHDVGEGTSKANSAIVHTGFDAYPGTLESELVTRASRMWPDIAYRLRIPFEQTSALLIARTTEQAEKLPQLHRRALDNGVDDVERVSGRRARELEPNLGANVRGALLIPREGVIDPFQASIAMAEVACENGVDIAFGTDVQDIRDVDQPVKWVQCQDDIHYRSRIVVNAAGLGSRQLAERYGGESFAINPRRGQFIIFDRSARSLVHHILLPIPTAKTKGMLVTPTIFGNVLAGPTAEDLPPGHNHATQTTKSGIARVHENAVAMCPPLADHPIIATYAGLRCNCAQGSYWIRIDDGHRGMITVSGIRSTGLTSSIALAKHLVDRMAARCGVTFTEDEHARTARDERAWPGWWHRPYDAPARLRARPDYGQIVCVCEHVSRGEIDDALQSPLAPRTMDAIKRRTRALTGRCQGFQCGIPVARAIAAHCEIPLYAVTKKGPGTELATPPSGGDTPALSPSFLCEKTERHPGSPMVDTPPPRPQIALQTRARVVIVGAGPAGIGAAVGLARRGVGPVLVIERSPHVGGIPARYAAKPGGVPTFIDWPRARIRFGQEYAQILRTRLQRTDATVWLDSHVIDIDRVQRSLTVVGKEHGKQRIHADAIILACGARERTTLERGWIVGARPARVMTTLQLLELLDGDGIVPMKRPVVLGSDLIAYAVAAKLQFAGTDRPAIMDRRSRPATGWPARLYFRRWSQPRWNPTSNGVNSEVELVGTLAVRGVRSVTESRLLECDGVLVSGELIPNSELAMHAGLGVSLPDRVPIVEHGTQFAHPGFFAAGNIIGGFRGAVWCYCHGKRVARVTANFLAATTTSSRD